MPQKLGTSSSERSGPPSLSSCPQWTLSNTPLQSNPSRASLGRVSPDCPLFARPGAGAGYWNRHISGHLHASHEARPHCSVCFQGALHSGVVLRLDTLRRSTQTLPGQLAVWRPQMPQLEPPPRLGVGAAGLHPFQPLEPAVTHTEVQRGPEPKPHNWPGESGRAGLRCSPCAWGSRPRSFPQSWLSDQHPVLLQKRGGPAQACWPDPQHRTSQKTLQQQHLPRQALKHRQRKRR